MSASRDIAITVIITPMCCQQMTLAAPGVGERAPAVVGWGDWRPGPRALFCSGLRDCHVHLQ